MYQLHNSVPVAYMGKVRMEMGKLNPISKDNLKVGDVVGVAREVRCGWGLDTSWCIPQRLFV